LAERHAVDAFRKLGFDRTGRGLHYGPHGIDVYALKNTPHGLSLRRIEVKSTSDPRSSGTEAEVLARLDIGKRDGLQQGSRLWGEDRLLKAHSHEKRVASHILSGQARAGEGRIWQARDYVYWENVATGQRTIFRVINNHAGNRVLGLKLMWEKSRGEQ